MHCCTFCLKQAACRKCTKSRIRKVLCGLVLLSMSPSFPYLWHLSLGFGKCCRVRLVMLREIQTYVWPGPLPRRGLNANCNKFFDCVKNLVQTGAELPLGLGEKTFCKHTLLWTSQPSFAVVRGTWSAQTKRKVTSLSNALYSTKACSSFLMLYFVI